MSDKPDDFGWTPDSGRIWREVERFSDPPDAEQMELARRAAAACEERNRTWTPAQWDEWRNRLANDLAQFTD